MFAQESVMDIKKLKAEFEKLKYVEEKLEYLSFDEKKTLILSVMSRLISTSKLSVMRMILVKILSQ